MKTKILLFNFILLFIISGCDLFESPSSDQLSLQLEKYSFNVGDTLKGTFTVHNIMPFTVSYQFSTSCQFNIKILSGDKIMKNYPEICLMVPTSLTLRSGESKSYKFQLLLVDKNNNNLKEGNFTVEASLANKNSLIVSKSISIK